MSSRQKPFVVALSAIAALAFAESAYANRIPVVVTITKVRTDGRDANNLLCRSEDDPFVLLSAMDVQHNLATAPVNDDCIPIFEGIFTGGFRDVQWPFTFNFPDVMDSALINVQLWERNGNAIEPYDIIWQANEATVNVSIDLNTRTWAPKPDGAFIPAPFGHPVCTVGGGDATGGICFTVSVPPEVDSDGDGLSDDWEVNGLDTDDQNGVDVDLPALHADPWRKDIFIELDWLEAADHNHRPRQDALEDFVRAFANAPVTNLDGTTGIQLHVDVGSLFGAGVQIPVVGANGVTGWLGDLGGAGRGNMIPEAGNEILVFGSSFTNMWDVKAKNFDPLRAPVFRYGIFGHQSLDNCQSGVAEDSPGNDFLVTLGGIRDPAKGSACWGADVNGFSVGGRAEQAGLLMHEFGHVLGLTHAGSVQLNGPNYNNKPNYYSAMTHARSFCNVPASPAGLFPGGCDYSRFDMLTLVETSLDECQGMAPSEYGFGSFDFDKSGGAMSASSGTSCVPSTPNTHADLNGDSEETELTAPEDWNRLYYPFRKLQNYKDRTAASGLNGPVEQEPTPDSIAAARQQLSNLTAPSINLQVAAPTTLLPGQAFVASVTASNEGRGPALNSSLEIRLPSATQSVFGLNALLRGATEARSATYTLPANACPTVLKTSTAMSYVDFAGFSQVVTAEASTRVLDVTPPTFSLRLSTTQLSTPNHKLKTIQATLTYADECDPAPKVRLVSIVSNEPDDGLGDGDMSNDIQDAAVGTDDREFKVRAERSGLGGGRTYTVTYEVSDASGNTTVRSATVTVPR